MAIQTVTGMSTFRSDSDTRPERLAFLLLDQFSMIAFASRWNPLRLANREVNGTLYEWTLVSETGGPVTCSNGTRVAVDRGLDPLDRDWIIMVVGGLGIRAASTKPVLGWLRRESRKGMSVGAVCTATHTLAAAGLLEGRTCTIHWENRDSFREDYPDIELSQSIFVIDKNRFTASGGTAPADLVLQMISEKHGSDLSSAIAGTMIHSRIRSDRDDQRASIPTRIGVRHPKLAAVIKMMEDNIEEPMSPSVLAADVGMSTRQLERLFRRYLNRSPKRYYMELRLNRARNLLIQTEMSVIHVALACGFASPSHFSKCYRAHFDTTPLQGAWRERPPPGRAGLGMV